MRRYSTFLYVHTYILVSTLCFPHIIDYLLVFCLLSFTAKFLFEWMAKVLLTERGPWLSNKWELSDNTFRVVKERDIDFFKCNQMATESESFKTISPSVWNWLFQPMPAHYLVSRGKLQLEVIHGSFTRRVEGQTVTLREVWSPKMMARYSNIGIKVFIHRTNRLIPHLNRECRFVVNGKKTHNMCF